jgi:hypothetical protein
LGIKDGAAAPLSEIDLPAFSEPQSDSTWLENASMQLHLRLPAIRDHPNQGSPQHRRVTMQRGLVHLIK